ncbi:MAG: hypothetical protein IRZ26_07625, partial [Clostridia bacterium]|nr:hypothetical protein [Clostridia bacterium]
MSDPLLSQEEIDALRRSLEREEAAPRLAPEAAEALADLFARSLEEALRRTAPSLLDAGSQVDGEEAPPNQAAAAAAGRRAAVSGGGLARWEAVLWLGQGLEPGQALLDAWCGQLAEALEGLLAGSVEVIPGEAWSPGGLLPAEPAGFLFRWQGGGAAREAGLVAPRGALEALVEAAARGRGTAAATVAAGGAPSG